MGDTKKQWFPSVADACAHLGLSTGPASSEVCRWRRSGSRLSFPRCTCWSYRFGDDRKMFFESSAIPGLSYIWCQHTGCEDLISRVHPRDPSPPAAQFRRTKAA